MSTYHTNTYQNMPSSIDPPQDGQGEYSQMSQDSTRAQLDPSEDRHGVSSVKPTQTQVQNFQQMQLDPPEEKQADFAQRQAPPPKPPSPPPPEPTPPPPAGDEEPTENIIMERFKTDRSYSDHLVALAYTGGYWKDEDEGGGARH